MTETRSIIRIALCCIGALPPAAGLLSGCGGDEDTAASGGGPPAHEREEPGTGGDEGSVRQESSVTQSQGGDGQGTSIQSSSSGGTSQVQSSADGGVQMLSGSGRATIEKLELSEPSRLAWTNTEGRQFTAESADISISSTSGRGEVRLDAGTYEDIEIRGDVWTVVVRPE